MRRLQARVILTAAATLLALPLVGAAPAASVLGAAAAAQADSSIQPSCDGTCATGGWQNSFYDHASAALATASAHVFLRASAPASAATTPICGGTSLESSGRPAGLTIRIPTVTDAHPAQWACDLLPNNTPGLVPVERLQIDLNDCYGMGPFFHFTLTVDGEYGPATTQAVKDAQSLESVPQDGDYGPVTIQGSGGDAFAYQASGKPAGTCGSFFE